MLPVSVIGILGDGQEHAESGANTRLAIHPDAPFLCFGEGLGDREPNAGIAHTLDQNIVCPVQAGEDAPEILGRDAPAGVGHLDQDIFLAIFCFHLDA